MCTGSIKSLLSAPKYTHTNTYTHFLTHVCVYIDRKYTQWQKSFKNCQHSMYRWRVELNDCNSSTPREFQVLSLDHFMSLVPNFSICSNVDWTSNLFFFTLKKYKIEINWMKRNGLDFFYHFEVNRTHPLPPLADCIKLLFLFDLDIKTT